ncbi:MAG: hypothetical protein SH850_21245 [Planctomycetaceae bacterium]|nr:hypothetical protein [Planctomycetaceae bacterium]
MSAVSSQSSPDPRENPLAAQLALRHAEAVKSIEQALDGWFSVFGFTGTDCRTYEAATDDACHVVKLSPEYLNAEIDLRGDVPEQVLAALNDLRDYIDEAEESFREALAIGQVDLRPIRGYVVTVD